jgi:hypothetical protein
MDVVTAGSAFLVWKLPGFTRPLSLKRRVETGKEQSLFEVHIFALGFINSLTLTVALTQSGCWIERNPISTARRVCWSALS